MSMNGRLSDRLWFVMVYLGTVVPVFWWAPSPWDFLIAVGLVACLWSLYSRLRVYRLAAAYWAKRAEQLRAGEQG